MTVRSETERALKSLDLPESDAGVIAVLLRLAESVDDIDDSGLNPAGKLDNVSIPTYLKYAEALGMTPSSRAQLAVKAAKAGTAPAGPAASAKVLEMRKRRAGRTA